jgi:hypothetical protein
MLGHILNMVRLRLRDVRGNRQGAVRWLRRHGWRALALLVFVVIGPVWVLGLLLTPAAMVRAWCYRLCSGASYRFLGAWAPIAKRDRLPPLLRRHKGRWRHARAVR